MFKSVLAFAGFSPAPLPSETPAPKLASAPVPAAPPAEPARFRRTHEPVRPNSPGAAVRTLMFLAGRGNETTDSSWFRDPPAALHTRCAAVLGDDAYNYCRALVLTGQGLPLVSADRQYDAGENRALEHHLKTSLSTDLDTWEAALRILDADTAEARSWLKEPPEPLHVPYAVKEALKLREEARLARLRRGGARGAAAATKPASVEGQPTDVPSKPSTETEDPSGPKR